MQGVEATLETTKVDISDILPAPSEAMGSLAPPPLWAAIERELRDPNFDMMSCKGVAKRLNVRADEVQAGIANSLDAVRFSWMLSRDGQTLFTLATRPTNWRERVSEIHERVRRLPSGPLCCVGWEIGSDPGVPDRCFHAVDHYEVCSDGSQSV